MPTQPDQDNIDRCARASVALASYSLDDPEDFHTNLIGLLTDLRHWADAKGVDFGRALGMSWSHYCEESGQAPDDPTHPARPADRASAETKIQAIRDFLTDSPLPVVDAQAISDLIDGPREDEEEPDGFVCPHCDGDYQDATHFERTGYCSPACEASNRPPVQSA